MDENKVLLNSYFFSLGKLYILPSSGMLSNRNKNEGPGQTK